MKVLITTFGRDEAKINIARRDIGYEKLVIITDEPEQEAIKKIKEMESIAGGEVEVVKIDPYDFLGCFYKIEEIINKYKAHDIRFNVSGGPKVLSSAALLMCFNKGIPAYHCEERTTRLPVLKGVTFEEKITEDERKVLRKMKNRDNREGIGKKLGIRGHKLDVLLSRMENKGLITTKFEKGRSSIILTSIGEYLKRVVI